MKFFIVLSIILGTIFIQAQNVGINTPNPQYQLDVDGHINTTGTIVANGDKGKAGQMLVKNSVNDLAWSDLGGYKNFKQFLASSTFEVPSGVNQVLVELWSAGGGGSQFYGGGGGGYAKALLTVPVGETLNIVIGNGGSGSFSNISTATAGENTIINFGTGGGFQQIDLYGGGASSNNAPGSGSNLVLYNNTIPLIFHAGTNGYGYDIKYSQANATQFAKHTYHGNGGDAPNSFNSGGYGGVSILVGSTTTEIPGRSIQTIGGGGGASGTNGHAGGSGQVILHW